MKSLHTDHRKNRVHPTLTYPSDTFIYPKLTHDGRSVYFYIDKASINYRGFILSNRLFRIFEAVDILLRHRNLFVPGKQLDLLSVEFEKLMRQLRQLMEQGRHCSFSTSQDPHQPSTDITLVLADTALIQNFGELRMDVSIFGLGYVGAVCAGCLAEKGHRIIGVDVNRDKIDLINHGKSPIVEQGLEPLLAQGVAQNRITATADVAYAVRNSALSMVCVGTPSKANGDLDLTYLLDVCEQIGQQLADKFEYHLVVIRSTVLPGTVMKSLLPVLERSSGKKVGADFGLAVNPEFLRESTAINDFYFPEMTVIGSFDQRSGDLLAKLYEGIDAPMIRKNIEVAEIIKYTCNVWHATKVAFANEIGGIAKAVGVDGRDVMDVICQDKKLNISAYYMKPGFAFGGSCLPKDVRALTYRANQLDLQLPLLQSLMPSNETHIKRGFDLVTGFGKRKIGILGISFKAGTDDLRESPMVELVERLLGKGYDIRIYDKNVDYARVHGANREFINSRIPHISSMLTSDLEAVVRDSEVVVIGNASDEFRQVVNTLPEHKQLVDLVGFMQPTSTADRTGICW